MPSSSPSTPGRAALGACPRARALARWLRAAAAAGLLACLTAPADAAAKAPRAAVAERPTLIVVLVVDQMRADYFERYGHQWSSGLRRLYESGARFSQGAYPYLATVTCAGHATIGTGTFPTTHGIVGNTWWDRRSGRTVSCTEDASKQPIGHGQAARPEGSQRAGSHSAHRLAVPTLAEALRADLGPASRAVSISLKPRSAIMLAGRRSDATIWFDGTGWATSTAFSAAPIGFVQEYASAHPVEADLDKVWTRRLPEATYIGPDDARGERASEGWTPTFPHPLEGAAATPDGTFYAHWQASPFSDAYLGGLAAAAVDALHLGSGPGTDFLGVSFSALDSAGHGFGPRSHEVQDLLAGIDATLGRLFEHLDRKVGAGRYVVALSADHGVSPVPEQASADGIPAGRIVDRDVAARVEKALEPHLGAGPHVARALYTDLYFAPGVYARLQAKPEAMRAALDAVLGVPGVWRVLRREELRSRAQEDPLSRAAALSFSEDLSGDLIVVPRPYWIHVVAQNANDPSPGGAATHGTAHDYDQRVPVLLMGAAIRPGSYESAASPADIAPTLAFLAGITPGWTDGRVLTEALSSPAPLSTSAGAPAARPGSTPRKTTKARAPQKPKPSPTASPKCPPGFEDCR